MTMLYEVLKTAKMGAGKAPDLYTALLAKNLRRDGEVKTLSGIPPLTFTSNGQPLLDYLISGNTAQSGTPAPDNPIIPQGTGERTGNLADYKYLFSEDYTRKSQYFAYYKIEAEPNTTYTCSSNAPYSVEGNQTTFMIGLTDTQSTAGNGIFGEKKVTTDSTGVLYIAIRILGTTPVRVVDITDFENETYYIMLNSGSTALPFEPYGYKIPISSAGQTTPVYLGEVETTRKIKKLVLTGTENFTTENNIFATPFTGIVSGYYQSFCNVYSHQSSYAGVVNTNNTFAISNTRLLMHDSRYTSADDFKAYLTQQYAAGTPVTVWYVLANEETGIVNEPLHKIGDYADTVSMEQAGVQIPTVRGTNTLDLLTDVKPSEIYIKYKG